MPRMGLTRTSRRIAGWLAILAMSLNALWPLVANAKPSSAFDPATEICTVGGVKAFAGGDVTPQPADKAHQPNCSFCTLGADQFALPANAAAIVLPAVESPAFGAGVAGVPPAESSSYSPAHPRAPPVIS